MEKDYLGPRLSWYLWEGIKVWGLKRGALLGGIVGLLNLSLPIAILVCVIMCGVGALIGYNRAHKSADEARAADIRKIKAHENAMLRKLAETRTTYLSVLDLVPQAEKHLSQAEMEFKEGVFAPFWDQIEFATKNLAAFHEIVGRMKEQAVAYRAGVDGFSVPMPSLSTAIGALPDHRPATARLQSLVRRAQADFQFASIYEQRKTNKILVHGFTNLGSAIYSIGGSITTALQDLSITVQVGFSDLIDETRGQTMRLESLAQEHREFMMSQEKARTSARASSDRALWEKLDDQSKMLDNIQHGRRPRDMGFKR